MSIIVFEIYFLSSGEIVIKRVSQLLHILQEVYDICTTCALNLN